MMNNYGNIMMSEQFRKMESTYSPKSSPHGGGRSPVVARQDSSGTLKTTISLGKTPTIIQTGPFYSMKEPPGKGDLTGDKDLMTEYGLHHTLTKFKDKKVKESLASFLPNLPGIYDGMPSVENSTLRSIIEKPPIGGKELLPLSAVQLAGFRLHPGPLPDQYRALNTPPARKHKNKHKKHKNKDGAVPQETALMDSVGLETYEKKHKKQKRHEDDKERKKRKKEKKRKKKSHSPEPPSTNTSLVGGIGLGSGVGGLSMGSGGMLSGGLGSGLSLGSLAGLTSGLSASTSGLGGGIGVGNSSTLSGGGGTLLAQLQLHQQQHQQQQHQLQQQQQHPPQQQQLPTTPALHSLQHVQQQQQQHQHSQQQMLQTTSALLGTNAAAGLSAMMGVGVGVGGLGAGSGSGGGIGGLGLGIGGGNALSAGLSNATGMGMGGMVGGVGQMSATNNAAVGGGIGGSIGGSVAGGAGPGGLLLSQQTPLF